jgi:hypothetical protein
MKKRHGLARAIPAVDRAEAMPTGALLARLKRMRWCEESPETSDMSGEELASAAELILFKSDPRWCVAYKDLKDVLAAREHLARRS